MKFSADTLRKCKESGRKKFHLLPLLDNEEEGERGGLAGADEELSAI